MLHAFAIQDGTVTYANEDAGVILAVVLDSTADRSYLLVLDAQDFREIARAEVPQHIPFDFHGQFFGDTPA
jgi:carotenoid cleavage dioxygenase-like enzyme